MTDRKGECKALDPIPAMWQGRLGLAARATAVPLASVFALAAFAACADVAVPGFDSRSLDDYRQFLYSRGSYAGIGTLAIILLGGLGLACAVFWRRLRFVMLLSLPLLLLFAIMFLYGGVDKPLVFYDTLGARAGYDQYCLEYYRGHRRINDPRNRPPKPRPGAPAEVTHAYLAVARGWELNVPGNFNKKFDDSPVDTRK